MTDAIPAPDGYIYGVRFEDGSVAQRWSGRTQRAHAADYVDRLREQHYLFRPVRVIPNYTLVRRRPGSSGWSEP